MHHTIKILAAAVFSVCLCSCANSDKIDSHIENISHETDKYSINGERIVLDTGTAGAVEFNENAENEIKSWTEDFEVRVAGLQIFGSTQPCLQMRQTVKKDSGNIFSVVTEKYVYLSGLHGNTWWSARTYDATLDRTLTLSDLFVDDTYITILQERMRELIENDSETYHDLWEQPSIDENRQDKFYLDDKTLVIFYEPYELSYYARGVVEFPIPLEKIRGYVKEEYLPK